MLAVKACPLRDRSLGDAGEWSLSLPICAAGTFDPPSSLRAGGAKEASLLETLVSAWAEPGLPPHLERWCPNGLQAPPPPAYDIHMASPEKNETMHLSHKLRFLFSLTVTFS